MGDLKGPCVTRQRCRIVEPVNIWFEILLERKLAVEDIARVSSTRPRKNDESSDASDVIRSLSLSFHSQRLTID